jgi:hypothetical protein
VLCDLVKSIHHLFISCPFARLVWRVIEFTFNLSPPTKITNLFGNWLSAIVKEDRARIRVGVCALLWTVWNCRNDLVFNKTSHAIFYRLSTRLRTGSMHGLSFSRRGSGSLWILDAADWRRSHGLSTVRLAGGMLIE